jgi:hypothetical protein
MGTISTVGATITGAKIIAESGFGLWQNLNPWHVTFWLFALMLLALGVVHAAEKLDARFAGIQKELARGFENEAAARGQEHGWVNTELQLRDTRLLKLEAKPSSAKDYAHPG